MADSCGDCRFWEKGRSDLGRCRRYPQVEIHNGAHWCGEHQPRSAKAAEGVNGELLAALIDANRLIENATLFRGYAGGPLAEPWAASVRRANLDAIKNAEEASR